MEHTPYIGITRKHKDEVVSWFRTEFALWFWYCLYTPTQLSNSFEMSTTLIKRRDEELKLLNLICDLTGYSQEFFMKEIRTNIPKLYKTLPSYEAFKENVEAGRFTGISYENLHKMVRQRVNTLFSWLTLFNFKYGWIVIYEDRGCPNWKTDFTRIVPKPVQPEIIIDPNTDPYSIYNPKNAGYSKAQLDARKLADEKTELERIRKLAVENPPPPPPTTTKSNGLLFLGGGLALLTFIKIKK